MASTTITEALAELKTLKARIAKKREHTQHYVLRDSRVVDPLEADGGSVTYISREWQAIRDMELRFMSIRNAIQKQNLQTYLEIGGFRYSITDWLTWRREMVQDRLSFLKNLANSIQRARKEWTSQKAQFSNMPEKLAESQLVINLNEKDLLAEIEGIDSTLGELDGKLSLLNATTFITF